MLRTGGVQANRVIRVDTPLGPDKLLLHRLNGEEQLSQLFEYHLDLLSSDPNIPIESLLGQNITVHYKLPIGGTRYFNGYVSEFSYTGSLGEYAQYQAVMRPWYWLLTRTSDSRIFQFMTVPDILKAVFADNGFSDYEVRLYGDYREWEYCVQYRETDYNFLARLMEQEGIYYYFKHQAGKHILVLTDAISAHDPYPGYAQVPFHASTHAVLKEHIRAWRVGKQVQPGKVAVNDFNFQTPRADLKADRPQPRPHAHAAHEIYDYPGDYGNRGEGEGYARIRLEELQARHTLMHGRGNVGGIAPGYLFTLEKHSRADQNQEYLVQQASYILHAEDYESGGQDEGASFDVTFTVLPASESYRSPRRTPKPSVQGPQTAIVTGPPGEEIYPDEYGRVKVQFHWDRYGKRNEHSSCWIRVSQAWAGKGWGAMHIPRIGQEVIVDFLEGDPDRPIITGRVYNADNMPPYSLPANKTQSGIKSRSSKGGGPAHCNELCFEDKKGQEHLLLHAEKNQDIEVENDEGHWVGHDRSKTIDHDETSHIKHDRTETVDNDEKITIHHDRSERVDNNETISIGVNRNEEVGNNEKIRIGNNQRIRVGSDQKVKIGSNRSVKIGGSKSETVGKTKTETIAIAKMLSIGAGYQVSVGAAKNETVGLSSTEQVGILKHVVVGKRFELKVGASSLILNADGTIILSGKEIKIEGGKHIEILSKLVDIN